MDSFSNGSTTIYLVRHGETEMNRESRIQGHSDSPLTHSGENQAQQLAQRLSELFFDMVFSSDLKRAKRTAEILTEHRLTTVHTTSALRERSFGAYEGCASSDFILDHAEARTHFESLSCEKRWDYQLLGGVETNRSACDRAIAFLQDISCIHTGKNILCVSHAGILRLILTHLGWARFEELPWGTIGNCAFIRIESNGSLMRVTHVESIEKITERDPSLHVIF